MKEKSPTGGFPASWRRCAKIALFFSAISLFGPAASSSTNLALTHTAAAAKPATRSVSSARIKTDASKPALNFNGKQIYEAAFVALRDNHRALVDPTVRAKFVSLWQNRHAHDHVLDTEAGTNHAVFEMMWSLGQRYDYYNLPEANQNQAESRNAHLSGIGVVVMVTGNDKHAAALEKARARKNLKPLLSAKRHIEVTEQPAADTPAAKGGLKRGDFVVAIDGVSLNGKPFNEAIGSIRGVAGSTVRLTVIRHSVHHSRGHAAHSRHSHTLVSTQLELTFVRANVIMHAVHTQDLGSGITYIKLSHFNSQYGSDEMRAALKLASTGKAAILDLRGNPGGDVEQVIDIAGMLLDQGVIVQTIGRAGNHIYTSTRSVSHYWRKSSYQLDNSSPSMTAPAPRLGPVLPPAMPLIVLVDGGSFSASELLSGALQANHRALIVGQPTGGKGVGQIVLPLPGNRNMHVTNFEFRPGSKSMDWVGIVPDIEVVQPVNVDLADQSADAQLVRAKAEAIAASSGRPTAAASQAHIDSRAHALSKIVHAKFAKELIERHKTLAQPLAK